MRERPVFYTPVFVALGHTSSGVVSTLFPYLEQLGCRCPTGTKLFRCWGAVRPRVDRNERGNHVESARPPDGAELARFRGITALGRPSRPTNECAQRIDPVTARKASRNAKRGLWAQPVSVLVVILAGHHLATLCADLFLIPNWFFRVWSS
jgi:hypothetical protein